MNSDDVKKILPEYSCDALSRAEVEEVERFLQQCPHCIAEWTSLQKALLTVSTTSQPLVNQEKSQEMWHSCLRYIEDKTEKERLSKKSRDYSLSPRLSWFRAPWLGWGSLATSCVVLGAVWFSAPSQNVVSTNADPNVASAPKAQAEWVSFQTPPAAATPYINHHTLMAFDPFSDRVGTTLVADTAAETAVIRVSTSDAIR